MRIFYVLIIAFALSSCDIDFGENGVVVDNQTGQRIEGVSVKMRNHHKNADDVTDVTGYFNVSRSESCGFNCDDNYTVTFTKPGYDTLSIGYSYRQTADFIEGRYDDTLVVKLQPLP